MTFDWSINVGQIMTLVGMLFALISAYYILKSDVRALSERMDVVEVSTRDQIAMNAKIIAEISAVRQDVAVIKDRLEPPTFSAQTPSKGA